MLSFKGKQKGQTVQITISSRTVIRVLLLVIVSMVLVAALRRAGHSLVLIFTAFFLSLALNGPVHWLALRIPGKRRGNRSLATALSFFAGHFGVGCVFAEYCAAVGAANQQFHQYCAAFVAGDAQPG